MSGVSDPRPPIFRVMFVCTANFCRSPIAEHLLRQAQERLDLNWTVESAGTQAVPGGRAHPRVERILAKRGISLDGWVTRRLTLEAIEGADLILTAATEHRREVVALDPRALPRTFPLLQFARFATGVPPVPAGHPGPEAGGILLERARAARATLQPRPDAEYQIDDPINRSKRAFRSCTSVIEDAITAVLVPIASGQRE